MVDSLLSTVTTGGATVPYYYGRPAFGSGEPETYIVYEAYDTPAEYSCNSYHHAEWTVTVNLYTQVLNPVFLNEVVSRFTAAGFSYQGGLPAGSGGENANRQKHVKEFKINLEV